MTCSCTPCFISFGLVGACSWTKLHFTLLTPSLVNFPTSKRGFVCFAEAVSFSFVFSIFKHSCCLRENVHAA